MINTSCLAIIFSSSFALLSSNFDITIDEQQYHSSLLNMDLSIAYVNENTHKEFWHTSVVDYEFIANLVCIERNNDLATKFELAENSSLLRISCNTHIEQKQKPKTYNLFKIIVNLLNKTHLCTKYLEDGCEDRAHLISLKLNSLNIENKKIWVQKVYSPQLDIFWKYHVGVVVKSVVENNNFDLVIDPVFSSEAITIDEWKANMIGSKEYDDYLRTISDCQEIIFYEGYYSTVREKFDYKWNEKLKGISPEEWEKVAENDGCALNIKKWNQTRDIKPVIPHKISESLVFVPHDFKENIFYYNQAKYIQQYYAYITFVEEQSVVEFHRKRKKEITFNDWCDFLSDTSLCPEKYANLNSNDNASLRFVECKVLENELIEFNKNASLDNCLSLVRRYNAFITSAKNNAYSEKLLLDYIYAENFKRSYKENLDYFRAFQFKNKVINLKEAAGIELCSELLREYELFNEAIKSCLEDEKIQLDKFIKQNK